MCDRLTTIVPQVLAALPKEHCLASHLHKHMSNRPMWGLNHKPPVYATDKTSLPFLYKYHLSSLNGLQ